MAEDATATRAAATCKRERLIQRRKALGLTQEALASLLAVERSTVVRWERGETEPLPWIRSKLAKALRVSADRLEELLDGARPAETRAPDNGQGERPATAVPRQLPAAVADFTGRGAELQALTRILDKASGGAPGTVVISAIGGTAGVGKTTLALHWAHTVAGRFGDGQLYVNLRGFDPSGTPATPTEAIRGFLTALGVPPEKIPPSADAQVGLYRGLLSDKRILIVLDNARDEQQVRPLLPAGPGNLVLVTSRSQVTGLAATEGAQLLSLGVLTQAEAIELLTARIGASRAAAEPAAVAEIATRCACLPLALAVAAARAVTRPGFPLSTLAAELRDSASRLDALDSGDPTVSVRAVFSWSYQQLDEDAARMFRLLGLHPGPEISTRAAASLTASSEPAARRLLSELAHAHLIAEQAPRRYAFHDLLRAYAAAQSRDDDSDTDRAAATARLLDHYLHTADQGALMLHPGHGPVTLTPPAPGAATEKFTDRQQAMAWFEAEHLALPAAVALADASGFDSHAWRLACAMTPFLLIRGHYQERVVVGRVALAAATRLDDANGQAMSSRHLARAFTDTGDHDQAVSYLMTSLSLYQRLGDHLNEGKVHQDLALLAERQGRCADALRHAEQALHAYQAIGHQAGQAHALNDVGWYHGRLGNYQQTRAFCRQALVLNADVGHRHLEGNIWDSLGSAEHHLGDFSEAAACYERALIIFRELGDRFNEAEILTHLGDTRQAVGGQSQAREAWWQAVTILDELGHPDADKVRDKLASLDGQNPDVGELAGR